MDKGNYVKIQNIGVGIIENKWDDEVQINICGTMYYRDLTENRQDIGNVEVSNEKEYIEFIKLMVKELTSKSKIKRNEAAQYNKEVDGVATKRKGKVTIINGNYAFGLTENSISQYHSSLLRDAKKAKKLKDKLKKEIDYYNHKQKLIKEYENQTQ